MAPSFYENFVHNDKLLECISKCYSEEEAHFPGFKMALQDEVNEP